MIDLRVHLFARAKDLAGTALLEVRLAPGTTVGQLRRLLSEQHPALAPLLDRCAIAVDREFAGEDRVFTANAEVAILPPVSGGSPQARTPA